MYVRARDIVLHEMLSLLSVLSLINSLKHLRDDSIFGSCQTLSERCQSRPILPIIGKMSHKPANVADQILTKDSSRN